MALKLLGKNRQKPKRRKETTVLIQQNPHKANRRQNIIDGRLIFFNIKIIEIVTVHLTIHLNLEEW